MSRKNNKTKQASSESQGQQTSETDVKSAVQRRVRYGLNVGIAVAVAVAVVLLVNWLVYTQYRSLSPDARRWVRYDLTSTRSYSLAEQTRGVLNNLTEQNTVISMLGGPESSELRDQRVRDLIDEYARNSKLVDSEHLIITEDEQRRAELLAELGGLFADDTESIRDALAQGFENLDTIDERLSELQQKLQQVIDAEVMDNRRDRESLYDLNARYLLLAEQANSVRESRTNQLGNNWNDRLTSDNPAPAEDGEDLPDYTLLLAELQQYFITMYQELLPATDQTARTLLTRISPRGADDQARREQVMEAKNQLATVAQTIRPPSDDQEGIVPKVLAMIRPLLTARIPARYDDARRVLSDRPCIVVRSENQARVIAAHRMFRGSAEDTAGNANTQEQFLGEEQLTGAFISMTLDPPPLIVFIRSNLPTPALTSVRADPAAGQDTQPVQGLYNNAAQRLRALGYEIDQWRGVDDPPRARQNQRVVWVTMPFIKPDPRNAQSMDQTLKRKVFEHVESRLAQGDSALIMLSPNPFVDPQRSNNASAQNNSLASDPQINLLREWGIDARVYLNAFLPVNENDEGRAMQSTPSFAVTRWPNESFVRQSLTGIVTYFQQAHPLVLNETPGIEHLELAALDQPGMFVQRFQPSERPGRPIQTEPGSEQDRVLIAAAAERGEARLITVGDGFWGTDQATTFGRLPDGREGPGLAGLPGATIAYPGNSELFISSVNWLAHQEQLIASSPRTQDVRRIGQIQASTLTTYRGLLLVGMPGLVFAVGVAVWLARRRA